MRAIIWQQRYTRTETRDPFQKRFLSWWLKEIRVTVTWNMMTLSLHNFARVTSWHVQICEVITIRIEITAVVFSNDFNYEVIKLCKMVPIPIPEVVSSLAGISVPLSQNEGLRSLTSRYYSPKPRRIFLQMTNDISKWPLNERHWLQFIMQGFWLFPFRGQSSATYANAMAYTHLWQDTTLIYLTVTFKTYGNTGT